MNNKISNKQIQPQRKIKILAYCDAPTCATGFGTVSRNILLGLQATGRFDISVLGINYHGNPHDFPFKIWPVFMNEDPYGRKKVFSMIQQMEFDILFFLQDTFILDFLPELHGALRHAGKKFKSIVYYPIDGKPKKQWLTNVDACDYTIAYSEFGKRESLKANPDIKIPQVIPHGANTSDYYVVNKNETEPFRARYFGGLKDSFVITNLNRNQQRKDIPRTIAAFKEFRKHVKNSILYLHMAKKDQGWNIPEILDQQGLDVAKDVILPENFGPNQGYPIGVVNLIYNISDCVVSTTLGEGWGLSIDSNSRVLCSNSVKKISDVNNNDLISLNGEDLNVVGNSTYEVPDKNIHKLVTYGNRELIGSEDHRIPIVTKGDVRLADIVVDDKVYIDKMVFKNEQPEFIDILDYINVDNIEYNETHVWKKMGFSPKTKHSISAIINDTGETKKVIENAIKVYFNEKVMNSERVNLMVQYLESIEYQRPLVKVRRYIPINSTFNKLIGYYVAEGDNEGGVGINLSFHAKEVDYHKEVCLAVKYLFGLSCVVRIRGNTAEVRCRSSIVSELFGNLCGVHAHNKVIPDIIFNGSEDMIKNCLIGYFNGDGCYTHSEIMCTTVSEDLHYQLLYLLSGFNIFGRRYVRLSSNNAFDICVSGMDRIKLANLFGIKYIVQSNYYREKNIEDLGNCWAVPVISNEVIENKYLFSDIAVEDKHYFVANTIVVHNSWLEAMATKTPVIMPRNTALVENITEDRGWLADSGTNLSLFTVIPNDNDIVRPLVDVDSMVKCMLEVYNNPEEAKRRAENAYAWVTTQMSWAGNIVPQWIKVFEKAYEDLISNENTLGPENTDIINSETI